MPRTLLFFNGGTQAAGAEPFVTDGTAAGTGLLVDILPGASSSNPADFAATGTGLVFSAQDGSTGGRGLFVTDGRAAGTVELKGDFLSITSSNGRLTFQVPTLAGITALGDGRVLFSGGVKPGAATLFVTDGTFAGTVALADFGPSPAYAPGTITALGNGRAVFALGSGSSAPGLWTTDGTAAGTVRLSTAIPTIGQVFGGRALTTMPDGAGGTLLGVTDGTAVGTATLRDFTATGAGSAGALGFFQSIGNGRVLFQYAAGGTAGNQLWVTDGTAAGTGLVLGGPVTDAAPQGLDPRPLGVLGQGRALFAANNGQYANSRTVLWVTDGTAAGTSQVADLNAAAGSLSFLSGAVPLSGGRVLVSLDRSASLAAGAGSNNSETIYVTDGTAAGTVPVLSVSTPRFTQGITQVALPDGRAMLATTEKSGTLHLYVSDGTVAGTVQFAQLPTNAAVGSPTLRALPDGRVVFTLTGTDGIDVLWGTGGTTAGTAPIGAVTIYGTPVVMTVADVDPLLDANYYLGRNPDVAISQFSAGQHYALSGWHEGRNPDALFSTTGYLNFYKDVAAAGVNPLTHYDANGWREGRDPSAAFDTTLYLLFNADVKAAGLDPLAHYLTHGQAEGRKVSAVVDSGKVRTLFDPTFYGLSNPDVTAAGVDLGTHYNTAGATERRDPDAYFDVKYYLQQNPDVAASGIDPVQHYFNVGWKEGRDPSTHFNTDKYLAAYADVRAAGVNPLQHFLASGIIEGRSGFGDRI